ncbi:hypothetical protein CDAR_387861 [Caerostris darwini]|uniref:Uncharacterized protein n=1 Tax=Caerostris darwini TaxID=1538125 RepID=A0AAV4SWX5_9ARAC|nr:hypothetical protein CDAR_387861 [Caerostris darwini]
MPEPHLVCTEIPELCLNPPHWRRPSTVRYPRGRTSRSAPTPEAHVLLRRRRISFQGRTETEEKKKKEGGQPSFGGRGSFAETGCRPTTRDRRGRHAPSGRVRKSAPRRSDGDHAPLVTCTP